MKIQYHGHSCFSIIPEENGKHILIDPFLNGNPLARISPEDINPDFILVTHGHSDHLGDTVSIALRTGCTVICNVEIAAYLRSKGVTNIHGMNIGGGRQFSCGYIKMISATHSSSIEENGQTIYLGNPSGYLIKADGRIILHAGDTGLSHEMTLVGNSNRIDLAILPIGGNFTMDEKDAMLAARALRARQVIPMHYNTFDLIQADVNFFSNQLLNFGIVCPVLQPEETYEL